MAKTSAAAAMKKPARTHEKNKTGDNHSTGKSVTDRVIQSGGKPSGKDGISSYAFGLPAIGRITY
jgi:hypothetical protein